MRVLEHQPDDSGEVVYTPDERHPSNIPPLYNDNFLATSGGLKINTTTTHQPKDPSNSNAELLAFPHKDNCGVKVGDVIHYFGERMTDNRFMFVENKCNICEHPCERSIASLAEGIDPFMTVTGADGQPILQVANFIDFRGDLGYAKI